MDPWLGAGIIMWLALWMLVRHERRENDRFFKEQVANLKRVEAQVLKTIWLAHGEETRLGQLDTLCCCSACRLTRQAMGFN